MSDYLSEEHLQVALEHLRTKTKSIHLAILAMLYNDVPVHGKAGGGSKKYGAKEDLAFLDKFFRVPGAPSGRPYFLPFGSKAGEGFRDSRYPGRTFQKLRTKDYIGAFFHPSNGRFGLLKQYIEVMRKAGGLPIVYLAAWLYRSEEVTSYKDLVDRVKKEFQLKKYELLGPDLLDEAVPAAFAAIPFRTEPVEDGELASLVGGVVAPPAPMMTLAEFVDSLSKSLKKQRIEHDVVALHVIARAFMARDIVVLVGAPGTGKTTLAEGVAKAVVSVFDKTHNVNTALETVHELYTLADFLGYQNLAGKFVPGGFASKVLLQEGSALAPSIIVIDECNLAKMDVYLGPYLSAVESDAPLNLPGVIDSDEIDTSEIELPRDAFLICTCNSYLDEPASRNALSTPVLRRSAVLELPNLLLRSRPDPTKGSAAFEGICESMLTRELEQLAQRKSEGRQSVFDHFRYHAAEMGQWSLWPDATRKLLVAVSTVLLEDAVSQRRFTLGLLRDVLLGVLSPTRGDWLTNAELALAEVLDVKVFPLLDSAPLSLLDRISGCFTAAAARAVLDTAAKRYADESARAGTPEEIVAPV